ncbi:alpha/beta hydrolase family protein [Flavobacterium sedimenticola]|uniref:Prolyl oligopeptidase family serine peptidase n=1 Tax=Flavobacterium sedimenticola TaxID=3043286 RepID=A0ABT6XSJ8_9FLAO|nr:prolyl oligopeptidase family serine peptidase [Flavobacterium sedimenticola]MDI9257955.1 prolyl oligopeptidase family serine peptidase [Flavobacterium sedimenticola]
MRDINSSIFFIIFFGFVSCSLWGQVSPKKHLAESDYGLWSTLEIKCASATGDWVCYNLAYESKSDTLFVRDKSAKKRFAFPKGTHGVFGRDNRFACLVGSTLKVLNLKTGFIKAIDSVRKFRFSSDGHTLVVLKENQQLVLERKGLAFAEIERVTGFYFNPSGTGMVYTIAKEKASLHYCPFDGIQEHFEKLASEKDVVFENIVWQQNGASFVCLKRDTGPKKENDGVRLYCYRLLDKREFELPIKSTGEGNVIDEKMVSKFTLSHDGKRVFFYLRAVRLSDNGKDVVQIWNGNDTWIYSQTEREAHPENQFCYVWWPDGGQFLKLTTAERSNIMLSGDGQYAITYNPKGVKTQFEFNNKIECFVLDLKSPDVGSHLQEKMCLADEVMPSFGGKYFLYRIDEDWFVYELLTKKHSRVSVNFQRKLHLLNTRGGVKPAFSIAGWTAHDADLLVYDDFDLWAISLKDLGVKRLTKGREKEIIFRIVPSTGQTKKIPILDGFTYPLLSLEKGFYLKAVGRRSKATGYYGWQGTAYPLLFEDKAVTDLCFTEGSLTLYCKVEDFNESPKLVALAKNRKPVEVFCSNPQQSSYYWGSSKLIDYEVNGKLLQGALFYPANYDAHKKYPMVVYIYEEMSNHVHNYVNPSVYNGGGLNLSVLTSKGYFVLYPDIAYETDYVGKSATDCTIGATQKVIEMGLIDKDKIALMGHSFGGYETAFIATQTDLFATVIVGAGVTDLVSSYLSVGWNNGRAEIWRYESDQWRMSKSLYEGMEVYLKNSPIMFADQVKVPLLIWTGELDRQVHYYQSIAFYNALRRLGKKQIMLVYPENRHRLTNDKSQIDFTRRYEQWLDYFLKGDTSPKWIENGIN